MVKKKKPSVKDKENNKRAVNYATGKTKYVWNLIIYVKIKSISSLIFPSKL